MSVTEVEAKPAPAVKPLPMGHGVQFYQVGTWSFDEEDRDLAYCDDAIAAWRAWREWVKMNGESK